MATYKGRVALVTGVSSGIGAAIAEDLVKAGLIVVGAARRVERIEGLAARLKGQPGRLVPRKLDVSKENEIEEIFAWIEKELGGVDVLVNNAAIVNHTPIHQMSTEELRFLTNVNQMSVLLASRLAVQSFIRRNIDDGYIVNINSIAGHKAIFVPGISVSLYSATKHAITSICAGMRVDAKNAGLKFRVTSISPGAVKTEMLPDDLAPELFKDKVLTPEDVARTVTFVLSMPKTAEITELTIQPTGEIL